MKKRKWCRGQMSDAMPTLALLTLSGGLQDAYSYCVRGRVFANAQTGNIVLMGQQFFSGNWAGGLRYLIPVLAFACGVLTAEAVRGSQKHFQRLHWRQLITAGEFALLFLVGLLPHSLDFAANALVSFACAMQVQAFRKFHGDVCATTMCIGNLRSGVAFWGAYLRTKDPALLKRSARYFILILLFALGAGIGGLLSVSLGLRAIWVSSALLLAAFLLMFSPPEENRASA